MNVGSRARVARVGQLRASRRAAAPADATTRRRVALGAALESSARRSADCRSCAPADARERGELVALGALGALGVEELVDMGRVEGF